MNELNSLLEKQFVTLLTLLGASLVAGLAQIVTALTAELGWRRRMEFEVGHPGAPYSSIIVWPLRISVLVVAMLAVGCLAALVAGAFLMTGTTRWYIVWTLNHSIWLVVTYALVAPLVQLNALPRFWLWLWNWWNHPYSHGEPGWVNAKWQLERYKGFLGMNINQQGIERFASAVFSYLVKEKEPFPAGPARESDNVEPDELANYLLVACAIEYGTHQLYPDRPAVGDAAWKFLCWVRGQPPRPFRPCYISDCVKTGQSFYVRLRDLGRHLANPQGALPESIYIDNTAQKVVSRLVKEFGGHGSCLLHRSFLWNGSCHRHWRRALDPRGPTLTTPLGKGFYLRRLLRELAWFAGYEAGSEHGVFLKLAVDHDLWQVDESEPFIFSYHEGVALLFLNSGCAVVDFETKVITKTSETCDLIKETEHRLSEFLYDLLRRFRSESQTLQFSLTVFEKCPADVTRWEFTDYIDWWLWKHARKYCIARNRCEPVASSIEEKIRRRAYEMFEERGRQDGFAEEDWLGAKADICKLSIGEGGSCFCDASKSPWRAEGTHLRRD